MTGILGNEVLDFENPAFLNDNDKTIRDAIRTVYSRGAFAISSRTFNTSGALDPRYSVAYLDGSGGTFTLTLPTANYWGAAKSPLLFLENIAGTASITIAAAGSDTLLGAATYTLTQGSRIALLSDGVSKWYVHDTTYEESTWTPTDGSGAALVITKNTAYYTRRGRSVTVEANINYPVTASGLAAVIGGLPYTTLAQHTTSLFTNGAGGATVGRLNGTVVDLFAPGSVAITNANMSNAFLVFSTIYQI